MNAATTTASRNKISKLIGEMFYLMLGKRINSMDTDLVDDYIEIVSEIDDDNPIKKLLLLDDSFIESYINIDVQSSGALQEYKYITIYDEDII